jgi:hypothetical protein
MQNPAVYCKRIKQNYSYLACFGMCCSELLALGPVLKRKTILPNGDTRVVEAIICLLAISPQQDKRLETWHLLQLAFALCPPAASFIYALISRLHIMRIPTFARHFVQNDLCKGTSSSLEWFSEVHNCKAMHHHDAF